MRTGKTAKDIFAPTTEARPLISEPVQPVSGPEEWTKVTVVLFNRQIVFLDRLASDIRQQTGAAIRRAEIIRALIDALAESNMDLTTATSEADLKAILTGKWGR